MIETILAIGGIILTLIFGVYTILNTKKSQKKVSLGLEKKECYSLFKKEISRLNIDVNYAGSSIDNYLILFKGTLINNGHNDIDKSSVYKPLQIKSKNEFKWLEASLSEVPVGAQVDLNKINNNTLELKWDLLKKGELIEFETLIEIPQEIEIEDISDEFYNSLDFDYRITDLNSVDKLTETFPKEKSKIRKKRKLFYMGISMFLVGFYILLTPFLPEEVSLFKEKKEIYFWAEYNNQIVTLNLNPKYNGNILVMIGEEEEEELSIDEFNKQLTLKQINLVQSKKNTIWINIIGGIVYMFIGFMLSLLNSRVKSTFPIAKKT